MALVTDSNKKLLGTKDEHALVGQVPVLSMCPTTGLLVFKERTTDMFQKRRKTKERSESKKLETMEDRSNG